MDAITTAILTISLSTEAAEPMVHVALAHHGRAALFAPQRAESRNPMARTRSILGGADGEDR